MSLISINDQPFSERMRPRCLDHLILPRNVIAALKGTAATGIIHLALSGPPGRGKTSLIRILIKETKADYMTFHGSKLKPNTMDKVIEFISGVCWNGPKVVVIEELDKVPALVQASLRGVIEEYDHCRFVITTNEIEKIDEPLLSRLQHISFVIDPLDEPRAVKQLLERYQETLAESGITYDPQHLRQLITTNFHDLRQVAIKVEFEIVNPGLAVLAAEGKTSPWTRELIEEL